MCGIRHTIELECTNSYPIGYCAFSCTVSGVTLSVIKSTLTRLRFAVCIPRTTPSLCNTATAKPSSVVNEGIGMGGRKTYLDELVFILSLGYSGKVTSRTVNCGRGCAGGPTGINCI